MPPNPTVGATAVVVSSVVVGVLLTGFDTVGETVGAVNTGDGLDVVVGAGDTVTGLFAASNAFAFRSLSPPANIIPDNVPVKNVAIGMIISKNFWSIGLMAFKGCVIKMIEYRTTKTIPVNVIAKQIPIKN